MRVAIYGGSFNPPHLGHAMVAAWLTWTDQVDAVWLVPVAGHAFGKNLAPFERRCAWCEALGEAVGPSIRVCSIEEQLPKPSYTLNTLRALQERWPEHSFRLVIGADTLPQTPQWHRWSEIEADFAPIVVGRAGYESPEDMPVFPGISSTDVRERMAQDRPVSALVPATVMAKIDPEDIRRWRELFGS
ncbi:MAG: nicotinate (nicotinamide) nucleotide adenylyltransferase [Myxococcota bacterium]